MSFRVDQIPGILKRNFPGTTFTCSRALNVGAMKHYCLIQWCTPDLAQPKENDVKSVIAQEITPEMQESAGIDYYAYRHVNIPDRLW